MATITLSRPFRPRSHAPAATLLSVGRCGVAGTEGQARSSPRDPEIFLEVLPDLSCGATAPRLTMHSPLSVCLCVLGAARRYDVNITHIESRPTKQDVWNPSLPRCFPAGSHLPGACNRRAPSNSSSTSMATSVGYLSRLLLHGLPPHAQHQAPSHPTGQALPASPRSHLPLRDLISMSRMALLGRR